MPLRVLQEVSFIQQGYDVCNSITFVMTKSKKGKNEKRKSEEVPTRNVFSAPLAERKGNTFGFSLENKVSAFISS